MQAGWQSIRDEVMRRIRAADWPPGALIPTEAALAAEFGAARGTVNRALRELAGAGVLERRRRAGTRVAALPPGRATLTIPVIRAEVEARGQTYAHRLLSRLSEVPPAAVALRMGLTADQRLLHIRALHLADGQPYAAEDRWLNPAILPDPAPDFAAISANEWLVANVRFTTGEVTLTAEPAGAEATVMDLSARTPVLVLNRVTWRDAVPVTAVRLVHAPGYRVRMQV